MTTILFLLGNRDLQIRADHGNHLLIGRYFIAQNDGEDLVIDKSREAGFRFDEAALATLEAYDSIKAAVRFPMIQATLDYLKVDRDCRLVFCTSKQEPEVHFQDSYPFAAFAQRYFAEQGYTSETAFFSCNPNDFGALVDYFGKLFDQIGIGPKKVYVSNSGGTPNMRAASHFAGVFRGFVYVHVNSFSEEVSQSTFERQEQMILQKIVQSKLEMYDYQGIVLLPAVSEEIKAICHEATNYFNLDTDYVHAQEDYDKRACHALELVFNSMKVSFKQGAYAETIQRIFRLEEAMGQLLLYRKLKHDNLLNEQAEIPENVAAGDRAVPFSRLLESRDEKMNLVTQHYFMALSWEVRYGQQNSYFLFSHFPRKAPLGAIAGGKNYFYFLFRSMGLHQDIYEFWEKPNGNYHKTNNPLAQLRNKSLVGHGFKGVSKAELEAVTGPFDAFCNDLEQLLAAMLGRPVSRIFKEFNSRILALINI